MDALAGFAKAEVFISADADGGLDMKSKIADDFSRGGCLTLSCVSTFLSSAPN
jgi:hypothetical protein